jgi:hypothetical protein
MRQIEVLIQKNEVLSRRNEEQTMIIADLMQKNVEQSRRIDLVLQHDEFETRKAQPIGLYQEPAFHIGTYHQCLPYNGAT